MSEIVLLKIYSHCMTHQVRSSYWISRRVVEAMVAEVEVQAVVDKAERDMSVLAVEKHPQPSRCLL